jgi:hypothetical protein
MNSLCCCWCWIVTWTQIIVSCNGTDVCNVECAGHTSTVLQEKGCCMCWLQDMGAAQEASLQAVCLAFLLCMDVLSTHSVCLSCRRESDWCSAMLCLEVLVQTAAFGLAGYVG